MSNPFHLAIPAEDLTVSTKFYVDILGCKTGNGEEGKWIDVDFWGNELTLHKSEHKLDSERHDVDMGNVSVPHFGVHLSRKDFDSLKQRLKDSGTSYHICTRGFHCFSSLGKAFIFTSTYYKSRLK